MCFSCDDVAVLADVDERVLALRRRHRDAVLANRINVAERWGQPCHAFNVHLEPSTTARDGLGRVQDALSAEPSLLRCPSSALHVSVAWLLAVHVDYVESKAAIWTRHGEEWTAQLASIARRHQPFELRYRWLVVTDTAVIAVATPVDPVRRLRDDIAARLSLPDQTVNTAEIVHTTLFRFRDALSDPSALIEAAEAIDLDLPTPVQHLTVSEELVFPSLVTSTKAQLTMPGAGDVWRG